MPVGVLRVILPVLPKLIVVATVSYNACVVCEPTNVGLLIVIVPLVAPISKSDAALNASTVVGVVANK